MNPALFPVTWELVPGRGAKEPQQQQALELAGRAAAGGRIAALTITDNPGGTPALSADFMSMEIVKKGIEPLVHFTSKDKNRRKNNIGKLEMKRKTRREIVRPKTGHWASGIRFFASLKNPYYFSPNDPSSIRSVIEK